MGAGRESEQPSCFLLFMSFLLLFALYSPPFPILYFVLEACEYEWGIVLGGGFVALFSWNALDPVRNHTCAL